MHPFEAEGYRETVRAIRIIGRDCIMKRIKMIESGAEVPNDILTHILQLACKLIFYDCPVNILKVLISGNKIGK